MLRSYQAIYEDTGSEDTDTCSLWLTSGTTGMPKLVMKSHRSFTDACVVEGKRFIGYTIAFKFISPAIRRILCPSKSSQRPFHFIFVCKLTPCDEYNLRTQIYFFYLIRWVILHLNKILGILFKRNTVCKILI